MSARRLVKLKEIYRMLEACAPGSEVKPGRHDLLIRFRGRVHFFPSGPHGKGGEGEIRVGKVRNLVRHLGIDPACAGKLLGIPFSDKGPSAPVR